MRAWTVQRTRIVLGTVLGVIYVIAGIVVGLWSSHWDSSSTGDRLLWLTFLVGGGVVVLLGLRLFERSPWPAASLISMGALAGALAIFWTIAAPVAAIALVVLSVISARRAVDGAPA
jgi:hypothetical protein